MVRSRPGMEPSKYLSILNRYSPTHLFISRASPLAGRMLRMVSEDMFFSLPTIQQSFYLSKARLSTDQLPRKTGLMIICMYPLLFVGFCDTFADTSTSRLFSCCCGHVTPPWLIRPVCKCYSGRLQCDSACLSKALIDDSLFYSIGTVSYLYLFTSTPP